MGSYISLLARPRVVAFKQYFTLYYPNLHVYEWGGQTINTMLNVINNSRGDHPLAQPL
jgi:hypothetical protein